MTFNVFAIRSGDDVGDDRLFPELSPHGERYPIQLAADDTNVASFVAKGVRVDRAAPSGNNKRNVLRLTDVRIDILVTGSRVVFHCEKYDKGGGWGGWGGAGLAIAVVANGVSKARAGVRRRGKAFVGQVRYPWLMQVGASPKAGFGTSDEVRLVLQDTDAAGGDLILVDLTLAKGAPVMAIARDIAQRAARHRLAGDHQLTDQHRATLTALADVGELTPVPKKFALYDMGSHYRPGVETSTYPEAAK